MKKDYEILDRFPKDTVLSNISLEKTDDGIELALSDNKIGGVFVIEFDIAKDIHNDLGEMLKDNILIKELRDLRMEIINKILEYEKKEDIERLVHIAQDLRWDD